jgi:hypothetical protein
MVAKISNQQLHLWQQESATEPNEGDWKKLVKMMNIIEVTKNDIATMSASDSNSLNQVVC